MCVFIYILVQVGESNRPSFRPGLEGGSSDDESFSGRSGPSVSGIEYRRSAEGQVINPPVTGITCPSLSYFLFCSLVDFAALLMFQNKCIIRLDMHQQVAVSW